VSEQRRDTMRLVTRFSAGTLELGIAVAVGIGIGYLLDTKVFGGRTTPWFTLFWLLCGVVAGFRSLIRVVRQLQEEGERDGNGNPP
jgi:ATP synthase protein I